MKRKRILVTGGAGFLGSHLCEHLVGYGHNVLVLDNFFTGRRQNLRFVRDEGGLFELVRADVVDAMHFEVDEIYHLACPASPVHYQRNPARTIRTCVEGTLRVLELAREVGARVLIASTSEVYGDPLAHPQVETYWGHVNPIGPRACYDEGKRCAEALATSWAAQYGVEVRIARIFNTYGPRMSPDDGRVVSNFVMQALRGEPITIYGDGLQTRSFMYVADLILGLTRLMGCDYAKPVNLGNPREFTMMELAELVIKLTNSTSQFARCALPADDPVKRRPDISLARERLDWEPTVDLETGLRATCCYFKEYL